MSELDRLVARYADQVAIPWSTARSDAERTLFVVYDRAKERQLRPKLLAFQMATEAAGKKWLLLDVTEEFPRWFAAHPYRDEYFEYPEDQPGAAEGRLEEFEDHLAVKFIKVLREEATVEHAVAVVGVGSLFGVAKVSAVMRRIASAVPGRLVIFFPGEKSENNYRLLGARDGWDYLATAITAD